MMRCKRISVQEMDRAERIRERLVRDVSGAGISTHRLAQCAGAPGDAAEIRLQLDPDMPPAKMCEMLHRVANVISDTIVTDCEPKLIQGMLDRHYDFLDDREREQVVETIAGEMSPGDDMTRRRIRRKGYILQRLYEYLREHDRLSLQGFVAFRLKDYVHSLSCRVEDAVNDLLVLREYAEWTELLRDLALPQLDSPARVHVTLHPGGDWSLWDDDEQQVDVDLPEDLLEWDPHREAEYPDALMAALIVVRPREVVVHEPGGGGESPRIIQALREIFSDRLRVCDGCEVCESH